LGSESEYHLGNLGRGVRVTIGSVGTAIEDVEEFGTDLDSWQDEHIINMQEMMSKFLILILTIPPIFEDQNRFCHLKYKSTRTAI
jgi:hypothetical protein